MTLLKYLLIGAVMAMSLYLSRRYRAFVSERIESGRELFGFLKFRGERMARFMSPKSEICRRFSGERLERCGFLPALREGKSFSEAFAVGADRLGISDSVRGLFEEIFSSMGCGYFKEECDMQRVAETRAERLLKDEEDALLKSSRVRTTLIISAALGVAILLL